METPRKAPGRSVKAPEAPKRGTVESMDVLPSTPKRAPQPAEEAPHTPEALTTSTISSIQAPLRPRRSSIFDNASFCPRRLDMDSSPESSAEVPYVPPSTPKRPSHNSDDIEDNRTTPAFKKAKVDEVDDLCRAPLRPGSLVVFERDFLVPTKLIFDDDEIHEAPETPKKVRNVPTVTAEAPLRPRRSSIMDRKSIRPCLLDDEEKISDVTEGPLTPTTVGQVPAGTVDAPLRPRRSSIFNREVAQSIRRCFDSLPSSSEATSDSEARNDNHLTSETPKPKPGRSSLDAQKRSPCHRLHRGTKSL